jgi:hypothetical protein
VLARLRVAPETPDPRIGGDQIGVGMYLEKIRLHHKNQMPCETAREMRTSRPLSVQYGLFGF